MTAVDTEKQQQQEIHVWELPLSKRIPNWRLSTIADNLLTPAPLPPLNPQPIPPRRDTIEVISLSLFKFSDLHGARSQGVPILVSPALLNIPARLLEVRWS